MKNTLICTKCNSNDIIRIRGSFGLNGAGNNIPTNPGAVLVTRYVCAKCGYVEEWIDEEKDISKLNEKFNHNRRDK